MIDDKSDPNFTVFGNVSKFCHLHRPTPKPKSRRLFISSFLYWVLLFICFFFCSCFSNWFIGLNGNVQNSIQNTRRKRKRGKKKSRICLEKSTINNEESSENWNDCHWHKILSSMNNPKCNYNWLTKKKIGESWYLHFSTVSTSADWYRLFGCCCCCLFFGIYFRSVHSVRVSVNAHYKYI